MAEHGPPSPGDGWVRNEGQQPAPTRGKRVHVVMRNGMRNKPTGGATNPPGWDADKSRWTRRGHGIRDFDIEWFRLV